MAKIFLKNKSIPDNVDKLRNKKKKEQKKRKETILKEQKLQSRIFLWKAIPIVRAKRDYLSYNPGRLERYK